MNKKYQKYIEYIVNELEPPYFINMKDQYGLSHDEYELVLSKVFNQPVNIQGVYNDNYVYDNQYHKLYQESSNGYWEKWEYNNQGNRIYYEHSNGYWYKKEYDGQGNQIYFENSNGFWVRYKYDEQGNKIYHEDSNGEIRDNRYE